MSELNVQDKLVLEYRDINTTDRRRNKIFIELRKYYMPKVNKLLSEFDKLYRDDIISSYDFFLLQCIHRWTGKNKNGKSCHFMSYFYPYAGIKLKTDTIDKYVLKYRRTVKLDGLVDSSMD